MLPQIRLERFSGVPLHDQLSGALRRLIHSGELPPGTRLPSTRMVARALQVSRQMVVVAYEQLQLEGYLRAGVGAGTWVAESLRPDLLRPAAADVRASTAAASAPRLSRRGEMLLRHRSPIDSSRPTLPFRPSAIAAEFFPTRTWLRLSASAWRAGPDALVQYGDVQGYRPLREAIADHLIRHRGVRTTADQILVTSGTQQSLEIIARMVLDEGDLAAVEDPCYDGTSSVLWAAGARLVPVPVDELGLHVAGSATQLEGVRVLYTTPSHQYPLGVTLSLQRRLALVEWARQAGAWIVEDDYDSEFRFGSRPLPALQGLDPGGRVIYLGTFSKVLAPGLRIGYMALPQELVEVFVHAREVTDNHPGLPAQAALADYMTKGHLERHISRMRGVYAERRAALRTALSDTFGSTFEIGPGEAGLHLTMLLGDIADVEVAALAFERGIDPQPLSVHYVGAERRNGLVLGYGGAAPPALRSAVSVLDHCIRNVRRTRRT